jgi:acetyl esterase/lipase
VAYALDPQVAAALARLAAAGEGVEPPVGDVVTRRRNAEGTFAFFDAQGAPITDVTAIDHATTAPDGADILLRWFVKDGGARGPAVYYVHGGGMILGSLRLYDRLIREYVSKSGIPALAVDYRLAPEHPHPTPAEDCYAGLVWLAEHASQLGLDPARIAVMGDSAGGGLAAGTALIARDRSGPALARQILVYPMLDDRSTVPDPALEPFVTWTYDDNLTGWGALLGADAGGEGVSAYAAPARADDLRALPATYIDVGELDIFRDEDITYARRIAETGTSVELHVHPGVPHAFEQYAASADVSRRAFADRLRVLRSF